MSPSLRLCVLFSTLLLPLTARAQIAAGQNKFLGNIIPASVPASFGTYWNQVTPENSGKWGLRDPPRCPLSGPLGHRCRQ